MWWGNEALALSFVTAVGTGLGLPNGSSNVGPLFIASAPASGLPRGCGYFSSFNPPANCTLLVLTPQTTFAIAERVSAIP